MKTDKIINTILIVLFITGLFESCKSPELKLAEFDKKLPEVFRTEASDSPSVAKISWREYFEDESLHRLIDSALVNNQELKILFQEIEIGKNEVLEKSGEYLPFVEAGAGAGLDKSGRYTREGALEHNLDIDEGKEFPDPVGDLRVGLSASWEVDIWRKLRNAKDAAQLRYLAQTEGKNYLVTLLISEIAASYYELMSLDNQLLIINKNLEIQEDALRKMQILKQSAKVNQLAVNRFEAQFLNTRNQQFNILQKIVETENRLYFLVGSYPNGISRNSDQFLQLSVGTVNAGIPSDLLQNRPDIRQAELELQASNIDVKVAKADFYPRIDLRAGIGYQAFEPSYLIKPESLILDAAGEIMAPLINRRAIKARFNMATARQLQALYDYEQTILNAYTEVLNQLSKLENFSNSLNFKQKEVEVLNESVEIANSLFQYAKADYIEVLLTQEEVLDAQMELMEIKLKQMNAKIQIYRSLGGGWN